MNFGETLRSLRKKKGETLHKLSIGTDIDSTLLSKFERNIRFPTNAQTRRIAGYFSMPIADLMALIVSSKIVYKYGLNEVTNKAINHVLEQLNSISPDKKR